MEDKGLPTQYLYSKMEDWNGEVGRAGPLFTFFNEGGGGFGRKLV